ncbi:MAG: hypothetical protein LUE31_06595 [Lachnospiraceae bacterium]|nr:hypothetical protein [Lachnospiraceae bacterium]
MREALLNLLVHREYSYRASALISIYTDRIEFVSIGGLVNGVTLNDIMMGISVCRNANLANIFYRLELIEAYGTGIRKIIDTYEGTGMTPQIETSDNAFKIILPNLNAPSSTGLPTEFDKSGETLDEKLILLLKDRGHIRRKEAEEQLGISRSVCGRILRKLVESGKIIQEGKGRNTHYHLP